MGPWRRDSPSNCHSLCCTTCPRRGRPVWPRILPWASHAGPGADTSPLGWLKLWPCGWRSPAVEGQANRQRGTDRQSQGAQNPSVPGALALQFCLPPCDLSGTSPATEMRKLPSDTCLPSPVPSRTTSGPQFGMRVCAILSSHTGRNSLR